jgi:hypothetical protein
MLAACVTTRERAQRPPLLQVAQPAGVWRADVDDEVVGKGMQDLDGAGVVVSGLLVRRLFVLADIDAEREARRDDGGEVLRDARGAGAVEPEAVDDGTILRQPEQPRLRVARLRQRRHRPDLDEPEAHGGPRRYRRALLVEPGGEPNRVVERQPENLLTKPEVGGLRQQPQRALHERQADRRQGQVVRALGIQGEQRRAD